LSEHEVAGGLKSVASALAALDCFLEDEELGVTDVARRLGVAKSTSHRLLTTLASRGLVEQNPENGRYRLGLHLFELGQLALERVELRRQSKALLEHLREASGWTVHLSIRDGADSLFLDRLATLRGMKAMGEYRRRWPLHATSSGKVICAHDPEGAHARIVAGFPVYTAHTLGSKAAFTAELERIRRQGYATSRGELMDSLASVAAPVLDGHGIAIAAISITGGVDELGENPDRQARLVQAAAKRLSAQMAGRG
jgi:DNA-binding IclR family transcriptional regulator